MFRIEVLRQGQWTDNVSRNDEEWATFTWQEALETVKSLPSDRDWVGLYRITQHDQDLETWTEVVRLIHAVKPSFTPTLTESEMQEASWHTPPERWNQPYRPEYAFIDGLLVKRIKEGQRIVDTQVTYGIEGVEPWNQWPNIDEKYWTDVKIKGD